MDDKIGALKIIDSDVEPREAEVIKSCDDPLRILFGRIYEKIEVSCVSGVPMNGETVRTNEKKLSFLRV